MAATLVLCLALGACNGAATSSSVAQPPTLSLPTGETLAVIGVTQEERGLRGAERQRLKDRRIGFGLANLLAEALFDTGKFRLLEEQEVHKRELIENLVSTYWIEPGATYSEQVLRSVAAQLGVALLAYGSVSHARSSRQSMSLGPFSRHEQKLQIGINVCLYAASTEAILCHAGRGEAQQEAMGIIYEFQGDRLAFVNNAAGKATHHAITLAVQELIASIRFGPR